MKSLTKRAKRNRLGIILAGVCVGLLYPLLNKDDLNSNVALLNGIVIGLSGGLFIAFLEISWNPISIRKLSFIKLMVFKGALYTSFFAVIVPLVVSLHRAVTYSDGFVEFFKDGGLWNFIFNEDYEMIMLYALFGTAFFLFTYQMSRKLGQGILWGTLSGKYHHPKEAEMAFMFLDLLDSTPIAERIGDVAYSNLLKDIFFDITDSIVLYSGKIYRYVGDEVVVYWPKNDRISKLNIVGACFSANAALRAKSEYYKSNHGLVPEMKAAFHVGKIVSGEIGEIKSQICFLGNVMVETAAMEKLCRQYNTSVLVSEQLFNLIELPKDYVTQVEGDLETSEGGSIRLISVKERK
jgi:adenylate cyclase